MANVEVGDLTLLNMHTREPKVYWRGLLVPNVLKVHVRWDDDDNQVKLVVQGQADAYDEMEAAGIEIKRRIA